MKRRMMWRATTAKGDTALVYSKDDFRHSPKTTFQRVMVLSENH